MKEAKQKKAFYKKWWFWVLAAIVAASAVGNSTDDKEVAKEAAPKAEETAAPAKQDVKKEETPKEQPKPEPKKEEPKKDGISKAEFEQVQNGMSYDEVKGIIGSEGELQSESEVAGYKTVMYMFKGESGIGANATMMFQNNELTSKSQFGLK